MKILLSDRAIQDFMQSPEDVTRCFHGLIRSLDTVPDFSHLHGHLGVKRLNHIRPTAWRHRCGDRRTVFTIARSDGETAVVIHRCGHRSTIYRDLPPYIKDSLNPYLTDLEEIDDQFESSLEDETPSEEILDDQYNSHERHYFLPQNLLKDGIEYDTLVDFIATGQFFQTPCLTSEQEVAANQYLNHSPHIYRIQGAAGTGKTTVGLYLAAKAVERGIYPIVILPNANLVRFAKKSLISLNPSLSLYPSTSESNQTDLTVIDWGNLRALLSGQHDQTLSSLETHQAIDEVIRTRAGHQYRRMQNMNFCHLYYGFVCDGSYGQTSRDGVSSTYDEAIQVLERWKERISERLAGRDLLDQIHRIRTNLLEGQNKFQNILQDKPLLFIIDEVQDYYWFELSTILQLSLSQNNQASVFLLGDENQRVTISGFTWAALSNQLSEEFQFQAEELNPLQRNFRNTASIAKVAQYILEEAFDLNQITNRARHFPSVSSPEDCYEEGSTPKMVVIDDGWLSSLAQSLNTPNREDNDHSKYVFIIRQEDTENTPVSQYAKNIDDSIVAYTIKEAKGQEFDAAIILYPFRLRREQLSVDDLYDWYTSFTRARRYMALLVSQSELSWLEDNIREKSSLRDIFDIEKGISPSDFAKEMRNEAKTLITLEQVRKRIGYRICQTIAAWLNGAEMPKGLEPYCKKGRLTYWELADLVFETAQELASNEDNPVKLNSESFSPPQECSLDDQLVLYAGAFPWLIANKSNFTAWEDDIIINLESMLKGEDELRKIELELELEKVQNPLLRVLFLRACGRSWDAAEASIESAYNKHCIDGISRDLVRRSLPFESQRIKAKFLDEEIQDEVYFPGLLDTDSPLVEVLCNEFLTSLEG